MPGAGVGLGTNVGCWSAGTNVGCAVSVPLFSAATASGYCLPTQSGQGL